MKTWIGAALLAAMVATPVMAAETAAERAAATAARAAAAEEKKRLGSLFLRCDGEPDNMSGAESFARLMGAVTLLSIFAPAEETADPKKRLFAEKGVDACNQLIDLPEGEKNGYRRIPLILARAAHQIEAKNYSAAVADAGKAREEAKALGLVGNPYFDRSMGLGFDSLEAEATLRMGNAQAAQDISLRRIEPVAFSVYTLVDTQTFAPFLHTLSPLAEKQMASMARIFPSTTGSYADALEDVGRFGDAAQKREAYIALIEGLKPDDANSLYYARAALSFALAGNWEKAESRASFARSNLAARDAKGVPDSEAARAVEVLDLYDIAKAANAGKMTEARRSFAARSQWLNPSFGAVMETNRRLRGGAKPDELFGSLAHSADQMWEERRANALAVRLQKDTDNKTLFNLINAYAKVSEYEALSKNTWRTDKPRMITKEGDAKTGRFTVFALYPSQGSYDSLILHSALQAQARGKQGFNMIMMLDDDALRASVRFLNRGEPESDDTLFIDAATAVAELSKVIPSPTELEARRKTAK